MQDRQRQARVVGFEYPDDNGVPCYPLITNAEQEKADLYRNEAESLKAVHFVGRLAEYKYLNIDSVVDNALELTEGITNGSKSM